MREAGDSQHPCWPLRALTGERSDNTWLIYWTFRLSNDGSGPDLASSMSAPLLGTYTRRRSMRDAVHKSACLSQGSGARKEQAG